MRHFEFSNNSYGLADYQLVNDSVNGQLQGKRHMAQLLLLLAMSNSRSGSHLMFAPRPGSVDARIWGGHDGRE